MNPKERMFLHEMCEIKLYSGDVLNITLPYLLDLWAQVLYEGGWSMWNHLEISVFFDLTTPLFSPLCLRWKCATRKTRWISWSKRFSHSCRGQGDWQNIFCKKNVLYFATGPLVKSNMTSDWIPTSGLKPPGPVAPPWSLWRPKRWELDFAAKTKGGGWRWRSVFFFDYCCLKVFDQFKQRSDDRMKMITHENDHGTRQIQNFRSFKDLKAYQSTWKSMIS